MEPLLPRKERRFRHPGRQPLSDRQVLCGILFVLHRGIQWDFLPQELGFGSGMTCWRRLRDWNEAGVWRQLHEVMLAELNAAARLDWSRAVVDSSQVRAIKGGARRDRVGSIVANLIETPPDHRRTRHTVGNPFTSSAGTPDPPQRLLSGFQLEYAIADLGRPSDSADATMPSSRASVPISSRRCRSSRCGNNTANFSESWLRVSSGMRIPDQRAPGREATP